MSRLLIVCLFAALFLQVSCSPKMQVAASADLPVNPQETRNLYANMKRLQKKGIMFGHQDDLAYSLGWQYEDGRSDVKEVAGDYPAVMGWGLGHIELGSDVNLDSVPFSRMRSLAQQVYAQGGLKTFS